MPAVADSVSIFAEGTFQEQIRELVNYLSRGRSQEEQSTFSAPFEDALTVTEGAKPLEEDEEKRREIFGKVLDEVKGVGEGSEREIEGFFNLIYAHLLTLYPLDGPETKTRLSALLQTIASSHADPSIKYRILSNLFNAIPRTSSLRLTVYRTLLEVASANDDLDALQLSPSDVDKWLLEWEISQEERSDFLSALADAFNKAGQPETAYTYTLSHVRSLPSSSPTAQPAAVRAIATALQLPSIFNFDPLFKLDAVIAAKDHPLFSLLQIFLKSGLAEYKTWESSNASALGEHLPDKAQVERKIRLLTLASLAFDNVGGDLAYSKIASALEVDVSEVERWVIDVIRAGLVSGKLSQTTQTLHITRATARTFEHAQWEALEKRLLAWKTGLAAVLDVVAAATPKSSNRTTAVADGTSAEAQPQAIAASA